VSGGGRRCPVCGRNVAAHRASGARAGVGDHRQCDEGEFLYQVGTFPPHFSYFSRRSLRKLLSADGLRSVDRIGLLGASVARVAERSTHDSYVVLARPR
jgi:hypothetical protein